MNNTNDKELLVAWLILLIIGVSIFLSMNYILQGAIILSGYTNL